MYEIADNEKKDIWYKKKVFSLAVFIRQLNWRKERLIARCFTIQMPAEIMALEAERLLLL